MSANTYKFLAGLIVGLILVEIYFLSQGLTGWEKIAVILF